MLTCKEIIVRYRAMPLCCYQSQALSSGDISVRFDEEGRLNWKGLTLHDDQIASWSVLTHVDG